MKNLVIPIFIITGCICCCLIYWKNRTRNPLFDQSNQSFEPDGGPDMMYLKWYKRNFSFDGFTPAYKQQLRQVLEYQESLPMDYFEKNKIEDGVPLIIWWTPFTLETGSYRSCGESQRKCFFTSLRRYREVNRRRDKAFIFDGTNFQLHDTPMPRMIGEQWALIHDESPKKNFLFSYDEIISMFNHTATFSRHSHVPLLTQHLTSIEDLESTRYLVPTWEKNRLQWEDGLAPVVYVQSDCSTSSDRDVYVQALMKYIRIDSYGKCLKNRDLPFNLTNPLRDMASEEFYQVLAKYKFVLAMENAVCNDYVTEKLWRPFYVGSVPIVYGSPKVRDVLPDDGTAIEVRDFTSARQLAAYLHQLNKNDTAYDDYLKFKKTGGVRNKFLLDMVNQRKWGVTKDRSKSNLIQHFECLVCERISENMERKSANRSIKIWAAKPDHFGCPAPVTFSNDGVLLDDPSRSDYKASQFLSSFELEREKMNVFNDRYVAVSNYRIMYRDLVNEAVQRLKFKKMKNTEL